MQEVYIWIAADMEEQPSYKSCYLIAESFSDLIDRMSREDRRDSNEKTDIIETIRLGNTGRVRHHLLSGVNVDEKDENGESMLIIAAKHCWPRLVALLIEFGAEPDIRDESGYSALHWSCMNHSIDCARELLRANVDINVGDKEGRTPLMCSMRNHSYRLAYFLLEHGADVRRVSKHGETAADLCFHSPLRDRIIRASQGQ